MEDLLTPEDLAEFRALDESAMPSTCRVLRREIVPAGDETAFTTPVLIDGPVPCRLVDGSGQTRPAEVLGRPGDEPPATVALPLDTQVADMEFIEVTTVLHTAAGPITQVETFDVVGDPWAPSYATNLQVRVWREDERHAG